MPPRRRPTTDLPVRAVRYDDPREQLPAFLQYLEAECGMAENTRKAYQADLVRFMDWLSLRPIPIAEIDIRALQNYLQFLHDRQLAASSIARHLVSLKMFFRYLVLEGLLKDSVVELMSSPKLWQYLPHVLSPEMVDRLLAAPTEDDRFPYRDRALLCLLYATGCRASEVAKMALRDIHLSESFCRCIGKGNKERVVSLNPVAILAIENYLAYERPMLSGQRDATELFLSRRGAGFSRILVWKLVKKYATRIGASADVSPHTLRHSFATHMLAGGAEIRALQEILGHASIATTQIYTQVEHSRLKSLHRRCHPRG